MTPLRSRSFVRGKNGFTLIEVIIVITILAIMMGGALASFATFRDKNNVRSDALTLAAILQKIQAKAAAVELPDGCIGVMNFTIYMSGNDLGVSAICQSGTVILSELDYSLPHSTFEGSPSVIFDSRTGSANSTDIDICGSGHKFRISVNKVGYVGKPAYQGSC